MTPTTPPTQPDAGTPTARTDELYLNLQQHPSVEFAFDKMHDHALQLELDLATANKKIERLKELGTAAVCSYQWHDGDYWGDIVALRAYLAKLEKPE